MIIRTRNIPTEGLDLDFAIPPAVMRTGMEKDDEVDRMFTTSVECHVHLEADRKDIFLSGEAGTSIHPVCARCGDAFDAPFRVDLTLTCSPEPRPVPGSDSYQESDEGIVFYRNDELDLAEIVREQVLLTLPMRHLCRPDCLGLCPACGTNLNLGDHRCRAEAASNQ